MELSTRMNRSYGLATKARALQGQHAHVVAALREVSQLAFNVAGCQSYVVSTIPGEPDAIFITEFWSDRESRQSAFGLSGIYEIAVRFRALTTEIQQYELKPLAN